MKLLGLVVVTSRMTSRRGGTAVYNSINTECGKTDCVTLILFEPAVFSACTLFYFYFSFWNVLISISFFFFLFLLERVYKNLLLSWIMIIMQCVFVCACVYGCMCSFYYSYTFMCIGYGCEMFQKFLLGVVSYWWR